VKIKVIISPLANSFSDLRAPSALGCRLGAATKGLVIALLNNAKI